MNQFIRDDQVHSTMSIVTMMKRIWPYIRRHRIFFFSLILAVIVQTIASRGIPQIIGRAVDEGVGSKRPEVFTQALFGFFLLQILKISLDFLSSYGFQRLGNRVLVYIREDIIRHTLKLPMNYFNTTPVGRTLTRVTSDVSGLGDLFTDACVTMLMSSMEILGIIAALFMISPKLAFLTLLGTPLFIWASLYLSDRIRIILRDLKKVQSAMNAFLSESLNGIKVIHLYNHELKTDRKFVSYASDFFHHTVRSTKGYALMQPANNLFNAVTYATALGYGGYLAINGELGVGMLVAFVLHIQDYVPPLREIIEKYQSLQNSLASSERVFQMLDETLETNSGTLQNLTIQGRIEFDQVNFKYPRQASNALSDVSFELLPGESLAIIGRTGSGKSTLVSLFQRFYDVTTGSVKIDGHDVRDYELQFLRRNIGLVQQDSFVFRGSVADNVRLFDPAISDQTVQEALKECGYLNLLMKTGRDARFELEERGANISAGEKQLIAFARILAFAPQILILDEATSNIDSETEEIIREATHKLAKGRTSVLIAHRLSTIEKCDKILQLDQGRIVRSGRLKDLFPNGINRELYEETVIQENQTLG